MKAGSDDYTASVSFGQERLNNGSVELIFKTELPQWVRVYECDSSGRSRLLHDLVPEATQRAGMGERTS